MGNRFFIKYSVYSIVFFSLIFGSLQMNPLRPTLAQANDEEKPNAQKTLERIAKLEHVDAVEISNLVNGNTQQVIEISLWRITLELRKAGAPDYEVLNGLSQVLIDLLNKDDYTRQLFRTHALDLKELFGIFAARSSNTGGKIQEFFFDLDRIMNISPKEYKALRGSLGGSRGKQLAVISDLASADGKPTFEDSKRNLQNFKKILEDKIVEQPEVVEAFYDLEFETQVKGIGNTSEPPLFYLMGLPGVGKDTSAEALMDAYYNNGVDTDDHLFRVPLQKSKADAWSLFGSATGYVGSSDLTPFVKFLVKHSAGRYRIAAGKGGGQSGDYVEKNPDWKPGMILEGYYPPEKAAVFLNEFHNWSSEAKAVVVKEPLEKGIFKLNNPGKGVPLLVIPGIRFIAASNEGIELYANRDVDGSRFGEPLTYDEMMARWNKKAHDKDLLRQTIAKTASKNTPGTPKDEQVGTPEEILNRIHPSRMILMRPISPEGIRKIIRLRLNKINSQLNRAENGVFGSFEIKATDALVDFLRDYEYNAEDGARPVNDKVRSLMEYTFYRSLREAKAKPEDLKKGVTLDIQKNDDKTYSLIILKGLDDSPEIMSKELIKGTLKEKDNKSISDDKIDSLLTLNERLKDRVFGAEKAIEKISRAMLLSEEARHTKKNNWNNHEKATSFAFFGPSSTGKSEMAKALVNELYPDQGEQRRVDIDFNKVQNPYHLEEYIWGRKEGRGAVPSEFMKKYDQYNGELVVVLEEMTNTPKEVLRGLYDLFRESHPKFADGKDRPMTNVTLIVTGNAGLEWYSNVPRDLPEAVRMAAWARTYQQATKATGKSRQTLDKYLPEPLTNRIGEQNIIWFAPLTFTAVRELTLAKTNGYLEKLKPSDGRRGWDVGFKNESDYTKVIETLEKEGFLLEEQGASIDRYVDTALNKDLRALLLTHKIPTGARVALEPRADQTEDLIRKTGKVSVNVTIEGQKAPLELILDAKKRETFPKENKSDLIQTAIHETGHEFIGRVLLGDKHKSDFITVIPGVAEINGQWIYYAGLRSAENVERLIYTKEAVERSIAGLLGGEVAQTIFSKGHRHDAGKSNDIERATQIARKAVLEWGLSQAWGNRSVPESQIATLSEADRNLLNIEVKNILDRSRNLAYNVILKNREVFSELAADLIRQGEIRSQGLETFYSKNASKIVPMTDQERDSTVVEAKLLPAGYNDVNYRKSHNVETADFFKVPDTIANIDDVVDAERMMQIAKARKPKVSPVLIGFNEESVKPGQSLMVIPEHSLTCSRLFQ